MTDQVERVAKAIFCAHKYTEDAGGNRLTWEDFVDEARAAIAAMTPQEPRCAKCGHPKSNHPYRHPFVSIAQDAAMDRLVAEGQRCDAMTPQEAAKVLADWEGFGRAMLEHWPVRDVDGAELFDLSLKYGLIAEVPGGYDPEQHIDAEGISPETGDPWYEYTFLEDSQ